jgi:hypothetical protein
MECGRISRNYTMLTPMRTARYDLRLDDIECEQEINRWLSITGCYSDIVAPSKIAESQVVVAILCSVCLDGTVPGHSRKEVVESCQP